MHALEKPVGSRRELQRKKEIVERERRRGNMSTYEHEKSIRIIPFNGKKEDWNIWQEKFLARARMLGYKNILKGKVTAPKDGEELDGSTDEGKMKLKLREANENAYEGLLLSITTKTRDGEVAFGIIIGCKSEEYSDGNAYLAWKRLSDKFASKSTPLLLKLK